MHPAPSVIAFTTLSGAGYGLAFLLCLGFGQPDALATKLAWVAALSMVAAGLLSSTLHLGNPQRAWRAFSQWRSSWLSREGCMAIITFVPLTILAALSIFLDAFSVPIGLVGAVCCVITVICTAMIYASLRTVPAWHTLLTPLVYLGFSLTSGLLLLALFLPPVRSGERDWLTLVTILALIGAFFIKYLWARRGMFSGYGTSSMESATGLGHIGRVRLLERPHMMGNYLTNEMVFRVGRRHNSLLWRIMVLLALVVPVICLALAVAAPAQAGWLALVALVSHLCGLLVERWLFFAGARHVVSLYYGGDAAEAA